MRREISMHYLDEFEYIRMVISLTKDTLNDIIEVKTELLRLL